jgi:hypothetical protein
MRKLPNIFFTLILPFLSACGGDSGTTSNSQSIQGLNLSGSWRWIGVECYNSTFSTRTAVATIAAGSYSSTTTINGNTATVQAINASGCALSYSNSIVANLTNGDSSGGIGTLTEGSASATISTGGSCSFSANLTVASGSISPTSISTSYNQGQNISGNTYEFIYNPPYLGIPSTLQVPGSPTNICLLIYQKL